MPSFPNPSSARIRDFLSGKDTRALVTFIHDPIYRQEADEEKILDMAQDVLRKDIADGVSFPSFLPDFGTVSTAALFGGEIIPADPVTGAMKHIKPVTDDIADILKIEPRRFEDSDFGKGLELYRKICTRLGAEAENVFMRTPDFQGPLNTLALVVDQIELMVAMTERPDVVKAAVSRVTDILIAYMKRFRAEAGRGRVIGNIWPYTTLPDDTGIAITQDYMPLLGAEHYAEFELPFLKRISDAFGGVQVHCCGKYRQHLEAMRSSGVKYLGLEVHYPETCVEDIYATFGDAVFIVPYVDATAKDEFPTLADLIRSWKGKPHAKGRYWIAWCYGWGGTDDLLDAVAEVFH